MSKSKTKNPCIICREQVKHKDGIQCKGACKKWAHFKCLGFCPNKVSDIKQGIEEVTCICPGCKATQQNEAQTCRKSPARPAIKCPPGSEVSPYKKNREQSKCVKANERRCPQHSPNANRCNNKGQHSQTSPRVSKDSACVGGDTSRLSFCTDSCPNLAKKRPNASELLQCPSPPQTRSLSDLPRSQAKDSKCGQPAQCSLQISNDKYQKIKCTLESLVTSAKTLSVQVQLLLCEIKELECKNTR